jgi:hypothetical protein
MAKPKYKITMRDLETPGGVAKLERDGHNRHTIHDALYKHTEGAPHRLREQIMSKLHDRNKPC